MKIRGIRVKFYEWDYVINGWMCMKSVNYPAAIHQKAIEDGHKWKEEGRCRRVTFQRVDF